MSNLQRSAYTVSVIIPVYNAEPFLAEAIESILGQTVPPQQVIVIDDGSTDGSAAVARRYLPHILFEQQPNAGAARARNRGVALARGDLLAFLDNDDCWMPDKLALQLAALQQAPEVEAVFGQLEQSHTAEAAHQAALAFANQYQDGYHLDTILIHRRAFERIGLFDSAWMIDALEWLWRARRMHLRTQVLPQVLAWRRIHGDNHSLREQSRAQAEYLRLVRQVLMEQRQTL